MQGIFLNGKINPVNDIRRDTNAILDIGFIVSCIHCWKNALRANNFEKKQCGLNL